MLVVMETMPYAHTRWGEEYPGDGQQSMGFVVVFGLIGLAAALTYCVIASIAHVLLRKQRVALLLWLDLALSLSFVCVLAWMGISAHYANK